MDPEERQEAHQMVGGDPDQVKEQLTSSCDGETAGGKEPSCGDESRHLESHLPEDPTAHLVEVHDQNDELVFTETLSLDCLPEPLVEKAAGAKEELSGLEEHRCTDSSWSWEATADKSDHLDDEIAFLDVPTVLDVTLEENWPGGSFEDDSSGVSELRCTLADEARASIVESDDLEDEPLNVSAGLDVTREADWPAWDLSRGHDSGFSDESSDTAAAIRLLENLRLESRSVAGAPHVANVTPPPARPLPLTSTPIAGSFPQGSEKRSPPP